MRVKVGRNNPTESVNIVVFAVIFSAIGAYLIVNSFAATSPSPTLAGGNVGTNSSLASSFGDWKWDAKSASIDPNSTSLVSTWLTYAIVNPNLATNNWAVATADAQASDPTYSIPLTDQGGSITARIPLGTKPDPSGDGHLTVRDVTAGTETDFWQAVYNTSSQRISSASAAVTFPIDSVNEQTSGWGGNAANTPLRRGLVTPEMIAGTGEVNATLQFGNPKIGGTTSTYRYPALHNAPTSDIRPDNTHLVEGTWLRLDPSLNVDSLGLPAWQVKIAKGLQNYGMILRDNSGSLSIYGENPINRGGSSLWANAGLSTAGGAGFSSNFPWNKMQVLSPPNTAPTPSGPTANLWIDPSGGSCQRSNIPNSYSDLSACSTFQDAYNAASPGDIIYVVNGAYPQQNMTGAPKSPGANVVFQPAPGSVVSMGTIVVEGPSYATFKDFTFSNRSSSIRVTNSETTLGSTNIIFENLSNLGKIYAEGYVKDITFRNIEAGDVVDNQSQIKKYDQSYPDQASPTGVIIENSTFHDYRVSSPSIHSECLQIINSVDVTLRKSKLYNCSGTAALGVTNGPHIRLTIENNWLAIGTGQAFYSAQITKNDTDLKFRYNSSPNAVIFSDTDTGGPYLITGNYMGYNSSLCGPGITTDYNVFSGGGCGTNDVSVGALKFASPSTNNYHLASNSEAKGRGNPTNYPAQDIDGDLRPDGTLPDAGADELTGTTTPKPGDTNGDNLVNIVDLSTVLSKWNTNFTSADFNKDGTVNVFDLSILLSNYGK